MKRYGDNFIPVVPTNRLVHTDKNPRRHNEECLCHDDLNAQLNQYYQDSVDE